MILKYRVSLPGIKGFARIYEVKSSTSLYSFHKQMRADMDFPQDQLVLFKAFGPDGEVSARYGIFDLGSGTIDAVTVGDCRKKGEDKFIYFYDTTNVKSVIVTLEDETDAAARPNVIYPLLVETKGPNPVEFENGYVAFEDLPEDKKKALDDDDDDDDDDLDGEDEDDEGADEIFDEDEDDE